MTKEEFDSAVKAIDKYLRSLCGTIDTRTALNNTLFSVHVQDAAETAKISFVRTIMNDGSTMVSPYFTDGTYDEMVLAGFNNLGDTSLEFRAAVIKNWKPLKASIMTEIETLLKAGKKLDDTLAAKAKAEEAKILHVYESVPSGFEI